MRNHIFVHLNGKNYVDRLKPILAGPLIFAGFVIAIGYLGTESAWTVLAGFALFGYYLNERMKWGRIYITEIREMPENKLRITYMDKNDVKEHMVDKSSLSIQRSRLPFRFSADKEEYLLFKDGKGFALKQYALGEWENELIDELMYDWQPEDQQLAAAM